jgi:hypothetical protein
MFLDFFSFLNLNLIFLNQIGRNRPVPLPVRTILPVTVVFRLVPPVIKTLVSLLMVKFRQPSHEFTFGVGMTFIPYPLVLTPLV